MKITIFALGVAASLPTFAAATAPDKIQTISMVVPVWEYMADNRWPRLGAEAGLTTFGTHIHGYDVTSLMKSEKGKAFIAGCDGYKITVEHELHAYWELLPRDLFKTHPEYFPVWNDDGVTRYRGNNCCPSSPEAIEIMCSNALKLAKSWAHGKKTCHRYFFWPDDLSHPCHCRKCRQYNSGEQMLLFENALVKKLRTWDPEATVAHLAYGCWLDVPKKIKPAEGVFLEYAPIDRLRSGPVDKKTLDDLKALLTAFPADTAQVLEYWLDNGLWTCWSGAQNRLPWNPERLRADIDAYAKLGIRHFASFGLKSSYLKDFGEKHVKTVLKEYVKAFRDWPYDRQPDDSARLKIDDFFSYEKDQKGEYFHLVGGNSTFDFRESTGEVMKWWPITGGEVKFIAATNGLAGTLKYNPPFGFAPVIRLDDTSVSYNVRSDAETMRRWKVNFFLQHQLKVSDDTITCSYGYYHNERQPTALPAHTFPDIRIQKPANVSVSDLNGWSVTETPTEIVISQDAHAPIPAGGKNGFVSGFSIRAGRRIFASDFSSNLNPYGSKAYTWSATEIGRGGKPGCLVWTNDNPKAKTGGFGCPCKGVRPGAGFDASIWVKVVGKDGKDGALEKDAPWVNAGGVWIGSFVSQDLAPLVRWSEANLKNDKFEKDRDGWRRFNVRMMMPYSTSASQPSIVLSARGAGKVLFDDFEVREIAYEIVSTLRSNRHRDEALDGTVRFAALAYVPKDLQPTTKATFSYINAEGRRIVRPADSLDLDHTELTLPVSELKVGASPVTVTITGANGDQLGSSTCIFTRLAAPSGRKVTFDDAHRAIVDGKRFFPLGMFVHRGTVDTPRRMEVYTEPKVFNAVMTYRSTMTAKELDKFEQFGLKVIASLNDHYEPAASGGRIFENAETPARAEAWTEEVVNRCKHHPALLAWYVLDEKPAHMKYAVKRKYEHLKQIDRDHPTFMVTYDQNATRTYMDSVDVTGLDKYVLFEGNIGHRPVDKVGWAAQTVKRATLDLLPMWCAPQSYGGSVFPTLEEMRAQTWQSIAAGANGILYYSFGEMDHSVWGAANPKPPTEEFMREFKIVSAAAAEVKDAFDILLSDPSSAIWGPLPEPIMMRAWKLENGNTALLVCNRYAKAYSTKIELTGAYALVRERLGKGATVADKELSLNLPESGVVLIELASLK